MGPNLSRILKNYWKRKRIVPKADKCLGTAFGTWRGVTQGHPALPIILNTVVDAVVQEALKLLCSQKEAHHGMGWSAGEKKLVYYAYAGRIAVRDHKWVQDALTVMVDIFCKMELEYNLNKTNAMVFTPGFIWGEWGETAYKRQATGEGATFRERKKKRVN